MTTRGERAAYRRRLTFTILAALLLGGLMLSLGWGAVKIAPAQVLGITLEKAGVQTGIEFSRQQSAVLWNIRLPRVLMGVVVGAALALAGVALQVAFRNRLAEPTLLGVSGAATLGVVVAYVLGLTSLGRWTLPVTGSLAAVASVAWLSRFARRHGRSDRLTLVLAGVALQLFLAGLVTLLVSAFRKPGMPDSTSLTLGALTGVFWQDVGVATALVLATAILLARRARVLNILLLDEGTAQALGVDVGRVRLALACLAGVATGTVVGYAGSIAFVGLIVPFAVRLLIGDDHRSLLPAAVLGGAAVVTVGDALARNLIAPMELPLGVLTTVAGGPLFFWLIGRGRGAGGW